MLIKIMMVVWGLTLVTSQVLHHREKEVKISSHKVTQLKGTQTQDNQE
jgi:hypothetical protein